MATKKKAKKGSSKESAPKLDPKDAVKSAKAALTTFLKDNKLSREKDYSKDKKHGAEFVKLSTAIEQAQSGLEEDGTKGKEITGKAKKEKKAPKGDGAGRAAKYEYPEGVTTADDKKKYRQKMRSEAAGGKPKKEGKAKEKADAPKGGKPEKATSKVKKSEKSEKSGKTKKKAKKASKND